MLSCAAPPPAGPMASAASVIPAVALYSELPSESRAHKLPAIARRLVENLPLAMFPNSKYETAEIDFQPGGILAIVTDGLTEVFDSHDRELGESYIEAALTRLATRPLPEISDNIFRSAKD
jgi:serine phosphatase RsbU (regulator of sigma subunit)